MKIKLLAQIFNSTLSCIHKCLRFSSMIHKKLIFGLLTIIFLTGCTAPTAMIGPVYTLSSTGNVLQAGFSYGSNQFITNYTGKTPIQNLGEITSQNSFSEKNIQKNTLESEDFYQLVKNKIEKSKGKIKLSIQ